MDPRNPEPQESQLPPLIAQLPPQTILPYIPQNLITSGTKRDCIRLRNLPAGAQVTDILSFLAEFSQFIIYQGVHMVYSAQVSSFCYDSLKTVKIKQYVLPSAFKVQLMRAVFPQNKKTTKKIQIK